MLRPLPSSMRAAATTPAEPVGEVRRSLPDRWQPSPISRRVGFRIERFGACSAFTATLRPAWSLSRPWRPVASECFRRCRYLHHPLRLLPAGTTVAGRDSHPLKNGAFPRRTRNDTLSLEGPLFAPS